MGFSRLVILTCCFLDTCQLILILYVIIYVEAFVDKWGRVVSTGEVRYRIAV